jgi:hypothetical protein
MFQEAIMILEFKVYCYLIARIDLNEALGAGVLDVVSRLVLNFTFTKLKKI